MRVLVCGGRDYANKQRVYEVLDGIDDETPIALIIEGGANGADKLGAQWAHHRGCQCQSFHANWNQHGKAAGPIRNQQMIDEGKPDLCVAFPGGRGTQDMVSRARAAGVRVMEVADSIG